MDVDIGYETKPGPGGGTETGMVLSLLFILAVRLRQSNSVSPLGCNYCPGNVALSCGVIHFREASSHLRALWSDGRLGHKQ